jgi:hypothetical protein
MASFPDLRPRSRSAKAESRAVRRRKSPVLLAVSAALLLTASLAVSELATLRGKKAHDASAFLTRELGPPLDTAPLVRAPARGVRVSIRKDGYRVTRDGATVALTSTVSGQRWRRHEHGVQRNSAVGRETILIDESSAEEFLTVSRHHARRTWRWQLDTKLQPRVAPNGYVGFFKGNRLAAIEIEPVAIFDARGRDVTPKGLRWSVARRGDQAWLELALDDRELEVPYTIDPTISFRAAGTVATSASGTSISVGIPGAAVAQDLLLLHVAVRSTTIPSTPAGWTVVGGTNTANNNISQVVFWRAAIASDAGTNVAVTIPNAAAVGVGTVYRGVNTSLNPPIQQTTTSSIANNRNVTCPGLTTSAADEMVVCHGTIAINGTWPGTGGGYTLKASGAQSTNISLGAYDQNVPTLGTVIAAATFSNVSGSNARSIGNTFGLTVDTSAPTATVTAPTEQTGTAAQYYDAGSKTHWFRSTGSGSFTLNASASDTHSGIYQIAFPDISALSGWSGSTGGADLSSPYSSPTNYTWTAGAVAAGSRTITATNNAQLNGTDAITISDDTTAPSVTAPTVAAGYYTSLSVPVTLNGGTDGGSGLASGSSVVQRDETTLSGGSCGSFGGSWTTVTLSGGADTTVQNGKCYQYREQLTDNVANTGSSSASATAKVDSAGPTNSLTLTSVAPAGSALKNGTTVYYRGVAVGGGSFKLRNAVSDTESGAASSQTAALGGTTTGWSHTPSTVSTPAGGPYDSSDFTWSEGATSSPTEVVTGRDDATNATAAAALTFVNDSTAPSGGALTVNGTAGSAGGTSSYDSDGSFTIGTRTDYVETQSGTESGLASSTLVRTSASFSSPDVCGSFGSPTTITGNPDQNGLATGCYRYTLTGTDNVGNAVSMSTTVKVDTSAPSDPSLTLANATGGAYYPGSGTRLFFRPDAANGGFDITASATDSDTGVASYSFPAGGSIGTNWSASGSGASRTYSYTGTATTNGSQNVTATNTAGGTSGNSTFDVTADSNAPTGGALTVNAIAATGGGSTSYDTDGSFPIDTRTDYSETASATASGLASSTLVRTSATFSSPDTCGSFGSPTTITGNPNQSGLSTGCYRYTLTGTDNVGNAVSISTTVKVDTSAPSSPSLTYSNATGGTYYPGSGSEIFFKPTAASGAFDLAASSGDGDTGISGYTFPTAGSMGTNWSVSGSGASRTYSFTPTAGEPGTKGVSASNNAGSSSSSNFIVTADSTAPSTTIQCNGAACQAGYYTSSPVTVTLSANDGAGSGVQKIRYTTDGTDPTPVNGSDYVGALSINTTATVKFRAYDNLGNEEAVGSQDILLDGTPPTLSLTLTENPAGAAQHVAGSTLFYRPGASGGTFRVAATADDPQTGVTSVDFPAIANVTGGGSQTTPPYREDYTWSASTTDATAHDVVATNGASATTTDPFTLTQDSGGPTGQTISLTGANAPYYGSASVTFTLGDGNDGSGSGIDASSRTVTRESAALTADSCGSFSADAGTYTSPDTSVSGGNCYRYTFTIADNVGNVSAGVSTTAKVDTANPAVSVSAPTELTGAGNQHYDSGSKTHFFRPGGAGSFSLGASASDVHTAVLQVGFPDVSGVSGWSGSTGGSDPSSPYSSPADYSWSAGAAEPGARSVTATDKAANSASDTITLAADSAAPTGQAITLTGATAPYYSGASVTFTLTDGNDGSGSGIDTPSRTVTRETGDLAAESCSNFSSDAGTYSSPDTAVSGGHCYRYTFTIRDNVGNVSSAVTATAKVDTDAPSVNVTAPAELTGAGNQHYDAGSLTHFFRPGGSGSFTLNATAADSQSGVTQVAFPDVAAVGGWSGSTGGADTTSPYSSPVDYDWSSGATAPGLRSLTATNGSGIDGTGTITLAADSNAPSGQTITLTGANAPYYGSASVTFSLGDGNDGSGSGLDTSSRTVTRESAPLTGDSCGSFSGDAGTYSSPDTSVSGGNCYRYTFTIADNVGNVSAGVSATAKVDTDDPSVSLTDPGTPVGGTITLTATSSDPSTAVQQVVFERSPAGASTWTTIGTDSAAPYTAAWNTTSVSDGQYDLRAVATDTVNHTGTSLVANRRVDNTAPNTTIDSNPPAVDNDSTPTFTFSSSESGSTFECRIDGGSWSSCASPHTVSPALTEGSHTFDVRATDAAGNTDATPASYTWTVDLGAPTVTITAPTTYLNSSDPSTYPVTASTPSGDVTHIDFFECSNASTDCATGTWTQFGTDSTSPYSADWSTPSSDGTKAIRALAVDAGSNTGENVRTITIDRTPPSNVTVSYPDGYVFGSFAITTDNGPDSDVDASTGVLERRTGDLADNSCSSYGGWVAASSPDTIASTKCAQYRYRLADNAGNWTTATSTNEAKSDTDAPTSIQADPGANLRQTVTLTAVASDTGGSSLASVAFQRRPSSGGSWTTIATDTTSPYSTSFDTTSVADGLYDFRSVATDVAGNAETAPAVVANRRVDNTPPSATMLSPGNPVRGTVTLTSNTSDTGGSGIATVGYELAPSGGSFNSQPASWDTTLVSDGLYDLRVVATDVAGNSTTSSLITTRVDNTPPALTFSSPASDAVVSGTVNLVATSSDASPANPPINFAYKLASDPPSAYTATGSSWNTTTLSAGDGLYDLRAQATDDAGNTRTVENTNIRVDNAPPTISITAPAPAINGSVPSPTTFSATATDVGGSGVTQVQFFECSNQSVDCATGVWSPLGTVAAPGPYEVSWTIPGTDGNHSLAAVATDNAGHPASAIRNVDVDRSAPNTTIVTKPADPSDAATPTFTFNSSEPGSTFECKVDAGFFAPCTTPHDVTGLTDNVHTFEVRATDPAGNTDATPDTWTWHRDTNDPTGTLDNPGANIRQNVTLTSTEDDPPANGYASGLDSVAYEYSADGTTWATIGTLNSPPFDSIVWNTTAVADGVYQLHIVVRDVAGNETTSAPVTNVRIDNTPPTTSQDDPGQFLRATKVLTGSAADSGSGIDHVDFERAPTGGGSWTLIATDSTPGDGFQASFDTTGVSDGHYDFRTVAYDVAGNQAAATPVTDRLVDNTPPDATINSPGPYLRGAVNLTSSTSDPGGANASGVVSVAYEYSTNGGGTWQSTGSSFDSTAVPDGNVDLHVIATDAAGNSTTSASITSLVDNTKPVTTDNAPAGWQSSAVTVTLTPNDGGGSGTNVTEYSVDGSPTYTVGTTVVIPAPADGSNDGAHTIAYFSVDNAGNIETVKSTTVLIDATPPACPSCSAADYLRGAVTLGASPSESGSGIQSVAFEYTDAGGSTWTTIGTDTTGPAPYTADWDTTAVADGHYDLRIRVTDNASNETTTNLSDKVVDNTAPDVAMVGAPTEGQLVTGTIAITASASDVTSPVGSVQFFVRGSLLGTDTTAPWTLNWDTTTGSDGAATIQVVVADMAGNTTSSAIRNVSVDNVSPTPTLTDPGQYLSGTVSLSASSDGDTTQVDFERRPAGGGSWVTIASDTTLPWGTSLDTTALADGLYDFRAVATDQTGHTGTSPLRTNIRIDNTSPAGSITTPANGATVGGPSVALGGSYSDAGSGVASVRYELRPTGGGLWSTIATSTSAPFSATWDATTVTTGSYDLRPVITDRAGNTFDGATITVTVDVTAPTVVLTNPGSTISGTVTLNATVSGSGATQVAFAASPAGGASWTSIATDTSAPWSAAFDTLSRGDGLYDLRATVSDGLGNTSSDVVTGIRIDNTAPRVVSSTPAEGSTVTGASSIALVASEAATPVGVTLDGATTVAPVISGTSITYNTGPLGAGPHTLAGELQDSSGKKEPFRVHFTVWAASGSVAPYVEKNTTGSSSTTLESADGFAAATMPAGAWSSSTADWVVLRVTPMPAPSGLTNGFAPGPEAVDVTAWWALAGTQVHEFSQPVNILMRSSAKGLVPATFEGGNWRVIARVPTPGTLPTGWEDGFYVDASGFHILTKHLSLFALLNDVEAPQPPQNVRGFLGPSGLTLRWTAGADNSGTYDFVTVYSDANDIGHFGVDYTAAGIGAWSPADPRVFRLKETDLAGNESALTRPLLPVPSLIGKTPDEAAAALAARGFTVGTLTPGGTGAAGTVTGPAGLVLAEEGSAIDLTVAPGGALSRLVFRVHTAPKFKPSARKKIAARITVTRAARVTAELFSPRGVKIYTWRFSVKAGRSIVKLNIPRQVRRAGVYSMRWTARAGRDTVSSRIKLRMLSARGTFAGAIEPIEVVLAGDASRGARTKLPKRRPRVVLATGVEPTFDEAASRKMDTRVIVVDADEFGLGLIRDLHTVFPSVKIVALSSSPRMLSRAMKAGATVALPRSTPPATLARVIQRLLKPVKPAKAKPRKGGRPAPTKN